MRHPQASVRLALFGLALLAHHVAAVSFEPTWVDLAPIEAVQARFQQKSALASQEVQPESYVDPSKGCLQIPFGVCIGDRELGGTSVFAGLNIPKGVVGWWNFDDAAAQDISGNLNNVVPTPAAGPGYFGSGASAYIQGKKSKWLYKIPHDAAYSSLEYTISFQLFLLSVPGETFATILAKGTDKSFGPSIFVDSTTKRLRIKISTGADGSSFTVMDSRSTVLLRRWTHIAFVVQYEVARLYINGILDVEMLLPSMPVPNKEPIYLGRDPWHGGVDCYLDEVKIYNRRVAASDLLTIGDTAFPGIGSEFVQLGCRECTHGEMQKACKGGFHLCSSQELSAGGLLVGRVMGWCDSDTDKIWTPGMSNIDNTGTALCCRNAA